jgi:lipopolysaccharide biosynthesis glycosyltransferase
MRTRLSDLSEGGILHYITHLKPWQEWYDNSLDSYYWSCINVSPWRNALPIKATTHQEYRLLAAKLFRQEKFKESAMILDRVANYLFKEKLSK